MSLFKLRRPTGRSVRDLAVFARDGWACRYCGCALKLKRRRTRFQNITIDHVVPRIQGGGDDSENLVTACSECNLRKRGRTPDQAWMSLRGCP